MNSSSATTQIRMSFLRALAVPLSLVMVGLKIPMFSVGFAPSEGSTAR